MVDKVIFLQERSEARCGNKKSRLWYETYRGKDNTFIPCLQITSNYYIKEWQSWIYSCSLLLVLEWNLIVRLKKCVGAKSDHIIPSIFIIIWFWKDNIYQEVIKNVDHPWNVYSYPREPIIYPAIDLAKYMISKPKILNGEWNIFERAS